MNDPAAGFAQDRSSSTGVPQASSPGRRWFRRRRALLVAVGGAVAVVLLAVGGVFIARGNSADVLAELTVQNGSAAQEYTEAWEALHSAAGAASMVYREAEGRVADEATRQAVADLLAPDDEQINLVLNQFGEQIPTSMIPTLAPDATASDARQRLEDTTSKTSIMAAYTVRINAAADAVRESMAQWELDHQ